MSTDISIYGKSWRFWCKAQKMAVDCWVHTALLKSNKQNRAVSEHGRRQDFWRAPENLRTKLRSSCVRIFCRAVPEL
jgi:hypothetical protein